MRIEEVEGLKRLIEKRIAHGKPMDEREDEEERITRKPVKVVEEERAELKPIDLITLKMSEGKAEILNIYPKEIPEVTGIPKVSDPDLDSILYYLRVQAALGQPKIDMVESDLQRLEDFGVSEDAIVQISSQFEKKITERDIIPLTGDTEDFLHRLYAELEKKIHDKYPDMPEDKVKDIIANAIHAAIRAHGAAGFEDYEVISRSTKGVLRSRYRI